MYTNAERQVSGEWRAGSCQWRRVAAAGCLRELRMANTVACQRHLAASAGSERSGQKERVANGDGGWRHRMYLVSASLPLAAMFSPFHRLSLPNIIYWLCFGCVNWNLFKYVFVCYLLLFPLAPSPLPAHSHIAWLSLQRFAFCQRHCFSIDVVTFVSVSFAASFPVASAGPLPLYLSHTHILFGYLLCPSLSLSLCHFCTFCKHFYGLPFAAAVSEPPALAPFTLSPSSSSSPSPSPSSHTPSPASTFCLYARAFYCCC